MLLSWKPVVKVRTMARSVGLTRVLARLGNASGYEERFGRAMLGAIHAGDTVWDIGANIGYYTEKFADAVGASGRVVAFEPVPGCFKELGDRAAGRPNVRLINAGLGEKSGTVAFDVGDGSVHPNARIVEGRGAEGKVLKLPIYAGEEAVRAQGLPAPTFAKVDVEGFELDVLRGMGGLLRSSACHDVFVEVHFGLLEKRGMSGAPEEIERLLREMGCKVRWVDASHVHGSRA